MPEFTTHTTADAAPEQVLQVLTDPDEIASWSPIPFKVEDLDGLRLEAGSRARVSGSLAGKRVGFDIEVHAADEGGLDTLWVADHLLQADPASSLEDPMLEGFVTLGMTPISPRPSA